MKTLSSMLIGLSTTLLAGICPSPADHEIPHQSRPTGALYQRDPFLECYDRNKEVCYCECLDPCLEIMPSAGPRVCDGANFYITGNFLYWAVYEEGLEYVLQGVQTGTDPEVTSKGSIEDPDFCTKPGFKVGLGYQLPHDNWDLFLQYTWIQGKGDGDTTGTNMETTWFRPILGDLIRAQAKWHLTINNFDLELGRNFYTSRYLTLRPFAGLKGGWHDSDYKLRYLCEISPSSEFVDRIHLDSFLWYLGMRAGCNSNWYLFKSFSIYGNAALSTNWAFFAIDRLDQQFFPAQPTIRRDTLFSRNTLHTVFPVLELGIGLEWDMFFSDNDYHLALALGWEEQVWWAHNIFITEAQPQHNLGDLAMQGLNFKVRFDF